MRRRWRDEMDRHLPYFKLLEAMGSAGCPVCRHAEEAVEATISTLLSELVNDSLTRQRIGASLGFCREDAWRLVSHGDVLGTAIVHRRLVQRLRDRVHADIGHPRPAPCLLCQTRRGAADRALRVLRNGLHDERLMAALRASDGLCRHHLEAAMHGLKNGDRGRLREIEESCLERLIGNLDELIRKSGDLFREEGLEPDERDAWTRAVTAVSGIDISRLPRRRAASFPPVPKSSD